MAPRSLRGATSRSPLGVWRPRPIQVCFPSGSHAGPLPGNSRFLLQISNACYRVCFIGGDMLVFFFYQSFWSLSPPQLVSYNCLLAYHVSGSINGFLAPCWHWYRCCDKALLLAPLTFLSALTLLSKVFLSIEIDIAIVYSIEQYRYG